MRLTKNGRRLLLGFVLILSGLAYFINVGGLGPLVAVAALLIGVFVLLGQL